MKTDHQLKSDVLTELAWNPSIDDEDIIVSAENGTVLLGGHVKSFAQKWEAERAVKAISGVRAIANDIEVRPAILRSDKDIAAAAVTALNSNVSVPVDAVKAIVRDGWVTLDGEVSHWYQKDAAQKALHQLWGVKGIINAIKVKPAARAGDVSGKIHQVFKRHANLDADKVHVNVNDGTVTLTGEVRCWHEREEAETAAWSAPGITRVQNNLSIAT